MASFSVESMIRGYHIYKDIWVAADGQVLQTRREVSNMHDPFAVAVIKDGTIVGHLPRKQSAICSLFLRRYGTISCQVSGSRRYSSDLPQGGLEIPCQLIFSGDEKIVQKAKDLLDKEKELEKENELNKEKELEKEKESEVIDVDDMSLPKRLKLTEEIDKECPWIELDGIGLTTTDRDIVIRGSQLHDKHIELHQWMLKHRFTFLSGLSSTLKVVAIGKWTENYVQVFHCRSNHWITASTVGCKNGEILCMILCTLHLILQQKLPLKEFSLTHV